jgi:hypothetical protein
MNKVTVPADKLEDMQREIEALRIRASMAEGAAAVVIGQRDLLADAARDFVRKVDEGRARSVDSYAKFTEALKEIP